MKQVKDSEQEGSTCRVSASVSVGCTCETLFLDRLPRPNLPAIRSRRGRPARRSGRRIAAGRRRPSSGSDRGLLRERERALRGSALVQRREGSKAAESRRRHSEAAAVRFGAAAAAQGVFWPAATRALLQRCCWNSNRPVVVAAVCERLSARRSRRAARVQ